MLLERDDTLTSGLSAPAQRLTEQPALEETATALTTAELMPLDPSAVMLLSILECLNAAHAQGRAQVSLAALCKRLELRMSTLQRLMTALSEQALVQVNMQKDRLVASLTAAGAEVAQALQAD